VIAVISPKGGVGKSTTTALLGMALALVRGNQVAALDANPDSGNLADRLQEQPSPWGAPELQLAAARITRYSDLVPYLTFSGSGLCAVRSGPGPGERLGPAEYRTLIDLLCRYCGVVVVDLGTGLREPAFQSVVEAADAVVAVTGPGADSAEVLVEGVDWLSRRYPALFRTVTGVVNAVPRGDGARQASKIAAELAGWVPAVVQVPADPHLAGGGVTDWARLGPRTHDACLELAATVIGTVPAAEGRRRPGTGPDAPRKAGAGGPHAGDPHASGPHASGPHGGAPSGGGLYAGAPYAGVPNGGPAVAAVATPEPPARTAVWRLGPRPGEPGRGDRQRAAWRRAIGAPVTTPKIIAVFSQRGGVGKTTTALHLGHALAMVRGDPVVALDANPDFGNLVARVGGPYSAHGAGDLLRSVGQVTRSADLLPYLTQAQSGLWVARSDSGPASRLGADEYRRLLRLLTRHSPLVVVDLGTGVREPAFLAIAEAADALVAVAEPASEAADTAVDALDWLSQQAPDKARVCTLVVNSARPGRSSVDVPALATANGLFVDQLARVPHDQHLAAGGVSRWALLSSQVQDAYLWLAAGIVSLLTDPDNENQAIPGKGIPHG
jgi:MinD-like ATPase involved in chromosome partitioning or flagellar assembly